MPLCRCQLPGVGTSTVSLLRATAGYVQRLHGTSLRPSSFASAPRRGRLRRRGHSSLHRCVSSQKTILRIAWDHLLVVAGRRFAVADYFNPESSPQAQASKEALNNGFGNEISREI